jgi:hypothetical protein
MSSVTLKNLVDQKYAAGDAVRVMKGLKNAFRKGKSPASHGVSMNKTAIDDSQVIHGGILPILTL